MKRTLVIFIFIHACAVWAGEPASSQPKPNPELKKQDFFVGNWTLTGETKSSPFGPAGRSFNPRSASSGCQVNFFLLLNPTREANGRN